MLTRLIMVQLRISYYSYMVIMHNIRRVAFTPLLDKAPLLLISNKKQMKFRSLLP